MAVNAPCKHCPERAVGCHAVCERYKAFKADKENENLRRREYNAAEDAEIRGKRRRMEIRKDRRAR